MARGPLNISAEGKPRKPTKFPVGWKSGKGYDNVFKHIAKLLANAGIEVDSNEVREMLLNKRSRL